MPMLSSMTSTSSFTPKICLLTTLLLGSMGLTQAQTIQAENAADSAPQAISAAIDAPEIVSIAVSGAGFLGRDAAMVTQVFKPKGSGPFPVLLFSHGRSGDPAVRAKLKHPTSNSQLRYWLQKGYAIVLPIRPGYGETGGIDRENSGAVFVASQCSVQPTYRRTAQNASHAILSALHWVQSQPWANKNRVILEGQSVGGFATVAAAATNPPGVIGYINFAGGASGSPTRSPGRSCDPEQLTEVYGEFGKTTRIPNLWIYAMNDQYFGADAPIAWHASFAAGGASQSTFEHAPAVPDGDGHGLSRHAQSYWAPYLDKFLLSLAD